MKCPVCEKQAVTFSEWSKGKTAFKTNCNSCGVELSANMVTIILFVLTLVVALAAAIFLAPMIMPEASRGETKLLFLLPTALIGAGITWFVGGYKQK